MSWLRLDDGFAANKKIVQLSDREFRVWVRTLCYCSEQDDPTVDRFTVGEVKGLTAKLVQRFHELELLDASGEAHEIHDWPNYRPKDSTGAERQARWRARRTVTNGVTQGVTEPLLEPSLARADPSRPDPELHAGSSSEVDPEKPAGELVDLNAVLKDMPDPLDWHGGIAEPKEEAR